MSMLTTPTRNAPGDHLFASDRHILVDCGSGILLLPERAGIASRIPCVSRNVRRCMTGMWRQRRTLWQGRFPDPLTAR
ncbi:MAG: hypothetical protein ACMUIL_08185 [bacterium]